MCFFDKVPTRPYTTELVQFDKRSAGVSSEGTRTVIRIGELKTALFRGSLEITLYKRKPFVQHRRGRFNNKRFHGHTVRRRPGQ